MSSFSILKARQSARTAVALSSASVFLVSGCGSSAPQTTAAHRLADRLPRIIGPARHYDVQVDGDPFALGRGRARRVNIEGRDVVMAPGLTMDRLTIEADDVSFDVKNRSLKHIGRVLFTGRLGQRNLDNYIARIKPDPSGLSITLRWDDMEVAVPVDVASLTTTARVSGTLTPALSGSDKLDFVANRGSVGIVPVPARIVNLAIDQVNPVLDLSRLRFPVAMTDAAVDRGSIVLKGTATIDKL